MEIIENRDQWITDFKKGWLAHLERTGETDFSQYVRVKNKSAPAGSAIDLSQSRLMLISTAGGYLTDSQEAFDAPNPLGDYSLRLFPLSTPFEALSFAHDHYDHRAVDADPQVLLPLRHLEAMAAEGVIGELAPTVISYSGYQPDAVRVVDELIPQIVDVALGEAIDAVLLVPA